MKNNLKPAAYLLSLATATVVLANSSVQAQTVENAIAPTSESQTAEVAESSIPATDLLSVPEQAAIASPVPGTTETTATSLSDRPDFKFATENTQLAQTIEPGTATRGGSSYVGAGVNIGFGGDSSFGDLGFTAFGKIGLTSTLSIRPALFVNDNVGLTIPLSYDFPVLREPFQQVAISPFIGIGPAFDFNNGDVSAVVTGGVDVPLSPQFVATAQINVVFIDNASAGLLLGVGYTFPGFFPQ